MILKSTSSVGGGENGLGTSSKQSSAGAGGDGEEIPLLIDS
jgi:hypothetical protein